MRKGKITGSTSTLFLCASCGGIEISERLYFSNPRDHAMVRLTIDNGTNKVIDTEPDGIGRAIARFNKRNPDRRTINTSYCSRDDFDILNKNSSRKTRSRV